MPTPVDRENHFASGIVNIGNDVLHKGAQKLLACSHRDVRRIPRCGEIIGQSGQIWRRCPGLRLIEGIEAFLAATHALQCGLPALLQLGSDQAVLRIASRIAPLGKRGLVARLLRFQSPDAALIGLDFHVPQFGLQRRFDCQRLHGAQQLSGDRLVGTPAAENKAARLTQLRVRKITPVYRLTNPATDLAPYATPIQRVPAVEDLNFLRDMRRMTR